MSTLFTYSINGNLVTHQGQNVIFDANNKEDVHHVVSHIRAIMMPFGIIKESDAAIITRLVNGGTIGAQERRIGGRRIEIKGLPVVRTEEVKSDGPDAVSIIEGDTMTIVSVDEFQTIAQEAKSGQYKLEQLSKGVAGQYKETRYETSSGIYLGIKVENISEGEAPIYRISPIETAPDPLEELAKSLEEERARDNEGIIFYTDDNMLDAIPSEHKLVCVIGPSGSGKTTMTSDFFRSSEILTSFTTRKPRKGEIDGRDYYFITKDQAQKLIDGDKCVEHISYNDELYGYTEEEVYNKLMRGTTAAVVTVEGYEAFREALGDRVVAIYVDIDPDTLKANMANRDDDPEAIEKRLSFYEKEAANKKLFVGRDDARIITVKDGFIHNRELFVKAVEELIK